jgi:hypothetical protein
MKHNAGQDHWYGPLVQAEQKVGEALASAEHKVEAAIAHDVDDTIRDLSRVEKKLERFGRVHPRVWWWVEVVLFVGFFAVLLAAQAHFSQNKMLP